MRHPRQIVSTVRLAQKVSHQNIVRQSAHHVLLPDSTKGRNLLHQNIDDHLKESINVGMLNGLQTVESVRRHTMMISVYLAHLPPR